MVPGHQYFLLHTRAELGTAPRLLARVPAGSGAQGAPLLVPLADEATSAFVTATISLLEDSSYAELAHCFY